MDLLGNKSSSFQQIYKGQNTFSTLKPNLNFSRPYSTSSKKPKYSNIFNIIDTSNNKQT